MIHRKSVKQLRRILMLFQSKLAEYDKNPARDKRMDYQLMPRSRLNHVLSSRIPAAHKKTVLLNQIGLLRINLFAEFDARIRALEQEGRLDEAIELMNDYVRNVAIPFIPRKKRPSLVNRFVDLVRSSKRLDPIEYIRQWGRKYRSWVEHRTSAMTSRIRRKTFCELRSIYHMVYAFSFSDENFPASPIIIIFDSSRSKGTR